HPTPVAVCCLQRRNLGGRIPCHSAITLTRAIRQGLVGIPSFLNRSLQEVWPVFSPSGAAGKYWWMSGVELGDSLTPQQHTLSSTRSTLASRPSKRLPTLSEESGSGRAMQCQFEATRWTW